MLSSKLQTARAKAALAERSAELERKKAEIEEQEQIHAAETARQKANLDIDLKLLAEQTDAVLAEAELALSEDFNGPDLPALDPVVRTAHFVASTKELNPTVPEFLPKQQQISAQATSVDDLSRFLLRKEVMMSRLVTFTDQSTAYHSWKSTFKAIVNEIGATPSEEIDLLIKWLGSTSRKYAISLKNAYITNPVEGLSMIWTRLDERYGAPECVYHDIVRRLESFTKVTAKDPVKLYDLADMLSEIEGLKEEQTYSSVLAYFDSAMGVNPVVAKLPSGLQEKWTSHASQYKIKHGVAFPPFGVFAKFVRDNSKIRNDPSFHYHNEATLQMNVVQRPGTNKRVVSVKKTQVEGKCPIHKTPHSLEECRAFKTKSHDEKRKFLADNKLCFLCFSDQHVARNCKAQVKCSVCSSKGHCSVMHKTTLPSSCEIREPHGGERHRTTRNQRSEEVADTDAVNNACTEICDQECAKSCAKILLVNMYSIENPDNVVKCYAILDEQSNRSLIKPDLVSRLGIHSKDHEYVLKSCAGTVVTSVRRANNCVIESVDGSVKYMLPTLIECSEIASYKHEICTPDNARLHEHLYGISDQLPELDANADILLLLGRDVPEVHHVIDQVVGPPGSPYTQLLGLGWVVVGEMCLGQIHTRDVVNVHRTFVLDDGRTSLFKPCDNSDFISVQDPVFVKTPDDDKPSMSIDDRRFVELMDSEFQRSQNGRWVAPLPFRFPRQRLPNNKDQAVKRAKVLHASLEKNPVKTQHFL